MNANLKIRQLIFGESGLIVIVQRMKDKEYFHCSASELFCDHERLTQFNLADIRLISYFATAEEHQFDFEFLKKIRDHD